MISVKKYALSGFDKKETLRYMGVKEKSSSYDALLDQALRLTEGIFDYRVCFCEMPINDLAFLISGSQDLEKNLRECESAIVFAATIGIGFDRLLAKHSASPTLALVLEAIGAERIEALCDAFNEDIKGQKGALGLSCKPRFSAGYGDFPLEAQRDIFALLDCPRKIGLCLNESLSMSPSKSVTAVIGVCK